MNYARQYPRFWLAYFVLSVVMLVVNAVHEAFANFGAASVMALLIAASNSSLVPVFAVAAFIVLGGPYLVALHQYIYRSPHLWA